MKMRSTTRGHMWNESFHTICSLLPKAMTHLPHFVLL